MNTFKTVGRAALFGAALILVGCAGPGVEPGRDAGRGAGGGSGSAAAGSDDRQTADSRRSVERERRGLERAVDDMGNVVYFDFDQSTLLPAARDVLDAHIALLKTSDGNVRLEGHADERGTREYNIALGERRARAVADYMSLNGVSRLRIETVSYGEERPEAFGSDEGSWRQNRRVEIK